jgi:hypothetical protein
MFANQLFTRMSAVKPQIKYRYLEAGFAVVGDHPQARRGEEGVGLLPGPAARAAPRGGRRRPRPRSAPQPFGVRVDIVHSPEIERESGGFAKYATNQNNAAVRLQLRAPARELPRSVPGGRERALQENFEVLSVTFNGEGMQMQADQRTRLAARRRMPTCC